MLDNNQAKSISEFTSWYYTDWFYWDGSRIKKDIRQKKTIFEFNFFKFVKYLIYETIFVWFIYFLMNNRYINDVIFLLSWLLLFNWIAWIIWGGILALMFYESIEIRRIQRTSAFKRESSKIDKLF